MSQELERFCKLIRRESCEEDSECCCKYARAAAKMLERCYEILNFEGPDGRYRDELNQRAAEAMKLEPKPVAVDAENHRHDADEEEARKSEWLDSLEEPR